MQKFNWGIIGPGGIAHQFAKALSVSQRGSLYGVASRNLERAKGFAEIYHAPITYADYDSLIRDQNVDVIYIATPHSHHFAYAKACLEAGKHVLMEKPICVNAKQVEHLISLSQSNRVVFQEAIWSRYMPCFETVKTWLAEGAIGEIQYITSQIGFAFSHLKDHRLTDINLAGGALLDLGVYSTSISQYLLGEYPQEVRAIGTLNGTGVDQNTLVNLRYPSGIYSQFTCTIGAQCSNVMSIHGTEGYIHIPAHFWNGNEACIFKNDTCDTRQRFPHKVNGFEYQIESVMDSIEIGRLFDNRISHNDMINVMETLDEVRSQIGLVYPEAIESV